MTHFYILDFSEVNKMKKSNLITLTSFLFMIIFILLIMFFWKSPERDTEQKDISSTEQTGTFSNLPESTKNNPSDDTKTSTPSKESSATKSGEVSSLSENEKVKMDDALFIGDSRTLGLCEYAGIKGADFFSNVGMSVYNIHKNTVSVPTIGKVTLTELLTHKKYGKIYIMLGINELGYNFNNTIDEYRKLVTFIKDKQPNAVIFMEANLHVTKSRSDSDEVVNNKAINQFNTALSKFADNNTLFYLDVNPLFDDLEGNLSSDKSEDTTHLYAKYYAKWGQWIINQSSISIRRNHFDRQR